MTHMDAGWVNSTNDPESEFTRDLNDPVRVHSHTGFKACSSPPVGYDWRSLLDERWYVFEKPKHVWLPTIQHLVLSWVTMTATS